MAPKPFVAAALFGVIALMILLAAAMVPASAVGQCGEANCGKIWTDNCLSTQRCVDQGWRGYNCVDDSSCSSGGVQTKNFEPTATTPAPETSSSSSVGQCGAKSCGKVWTAECLSTQRCVDQGWRGYNCVDDSSCSSGAPTRTPAPAMSAVGQCGAKGCGRIIKEDCQSYQRCTAKLGGYYCVDDTSCGAAPEKSAPTSIPTSSSVGSSCSSAGGVCRYGFVYYCNSGESNAGRKDCGYLQTCCTPGAAAGTPPAKGGGKCNNNGVCETGAGGESYLNCPADCPKPMSYSNNKAQPNNKTCEDGTPVNACSTTKPRFCSATGRLIDNPSKCGGTTTPAPNATCAAAGGTCKLISQTGDEDLGKKDCGYGRSCYRESEAYKQEQIDGLNNWLNEKCGQKDCGVVSKKDCLQTQRCYASSVPGAGQECIYDKRCAELKATSLQKYTVTKTIATGFIGGVDVGDYEVYVKSVDTTSKNALVKVIPPYSAFTVEPKIIPEGSSYRFFSADPGGGIDVKINIVTTDAAELTMTYKG